MADETFTITDRRRVDTAGLVRHPRMPSLPPLPYRRFRDAAEKSWRHIDTHLERGVRSGLLKPFLTWFHIRGLALSAKQTYAAIALLLAERNKPNTLPLQGAILTRSLLEAFGNVLALTSRRSAIDRFLQDGYRSRATQLSVKKELFGDQARWRDWLVDMDAALATEATMIGLSQRRQKNPGRTIPEWPSPYWLTRRRGATKRTSPVPALVSGNKARVFESTYQLWYSELSAYAHQRCGAAQMAIFCNEPGSHDEPGQLESNVIGEGLLFYTCILSELEVAASMPPATDLRVLWSLLCQLDENAKDLVRLRYRRLLGMAMVDQLAAVKSRSGRKYLAVFSETLRGARCNRLAPAPATMGLHASHVHGVRPARVRGRHPTTLGGTLMAAAA